MPNDDSDEFAAERLHPKGTYWCCRPTADIALTVLASAKLPLDVMLR